MKKSTAWWIAAVLLIVVFVSQSDLTKQRTPVLEEPKLIEEVPVELIFNESLLLDTAHTYAIEVADLNNDGWPDIVAGNFNERNVVYFNNKDGTFTKYYLERTDYTKDVKAADMNNDGYLDLVIGNFNQPSYVYYNDKNNGFYLNDELDKSFVEDVAVADLNKDGFNDIVLGTNYHENYVYLSNGQGGFSKVQWSDKIHVTSLNVYDVDKDSYPDVIVGADSETIKVYRNDGQGNLFLDHEFGIADMHNYDMKLIDYNKDGIMDLIEGNNKGKNILWTSMVDKIYEFGTGNTYAVAVADMDNNGFDDVIIGNYDESIQIYLNDNGVFTLDKELGKYYVHDMKIADINNDDRLDIVIAKDTQPSEVLLG